MDGHAASGRCSAGSHSFGTKGLGGFRLVVDGVVLFDGIQASDHDDPFEAFFGAPVPRGHVGLKAGERVEVSLTHVVPDGFLDASIVSVGFSLVHGEPERDPDELIEEAVAAAAAAEAAVVVVATTERVESEGFDRRHLGLPGRQDELVARVAAADPRTVVIVNAGSPVEMPWREDVAAVLLGWFPGQEAGSALADVLLGAEEPGGRLPTTWPARLEDAPVTQVVPAYGELPYDEGVFIGYRAWERRLAGQGRQVRPEPAYCFGHGLGYTDWEYETAEYTAPEAGDDGLGAVAFRVRNAGARDGREVVQVYLAVPGDDATERPLRRLAGFGSVEAAPGETAEAVITLPRRAAEIWDEETNGWRLIPGTYTAETGRSLADRRLTAEVVVSA